MDNFEEYTSPFSWRYGSKAMRSIWSETHKRLLWRKVWVALAQAESEYGLLTPEQVKDLQDHVDTIDIQQSLVIEKEIQHDLMAELQVYAKQSLSAGGSLHLGATSADIEDNTDALRIRESLAIIQSELRGLLISLASLIETWADLPVLAFTHLQPAEPTTLGYRLAFTAQDLLGAWEHIRSLQIRGKGFKGSVGTAASYTQLIGEENFDTFETQLSKLLDLPFFPITGQTYPRMQDYWVISSLAAVAASLNKLAFDLRVLQSPVIGEVSEPFGRQQVGSSAMPFKRNPITAEKIDSLSRWLAQLPRVAWDNAAFSLLERTLDDSANRRSMLPEAFLCADELVMSMQKLLDGLIVNQQATEHNLKEFGTFASIEPVLMLLTKAGADRQLMHSILREASMQAWEAIQRGEPNPLPDLIAKDERLQAFVPADQLRDQMYHLRHIGIAPKRTHEMAALIRKSIGIS